MSNDLTLIGVIAKLELKPDDIVILKSRDRISMETATRIEAYYKSLLPYGNKIVVLDNFDIEVLSPSKPAGSAA